MEAARHVCLLVPSLEAGGAERVISHLARGWVARGRPVTVVTLASAEADFYELPSEVGRLALDVWAGPGSRLRPLKLRRRLRQALQELQPAVAVSFILKMNLLSLEAGRGLGFPIVVCERIDPAYPFGRVWTTLRRALYPRASALVVQTAAAAEALAEIASPVHVIANPVVKPLVPDGTRSRPSSQVLAVGRLDLQKGFDVLLEAFARCATSFPDWNLVVAGEGPRRLELELQVERLGLRERVAFPGVVTDIGSFYAESSLFVLSSRWEGFPNVLAEALAMGLAVISSDCPSGPADLVRHGENGLLVPVGDVAALAKAMQRLMGNPEERVRLAAATPEMVGQHDLEVVLDQWDKVLMSVEKSAAEEC